MFIDSNQAACFATLVFLMMGVVMMMITLTIMMVMIAGLIVMMIVMASVDH